MLQEAVMKLGGKTGRPLSPPFGIDAGKRRSGTQHDLTVPGIRSILPFREKVLIRLLTFSSYPVAVMCS